MADKVQSKPVRVAKKIAQLSDGLGWVSFTPYQLSQLGIDPQKHTTTDLRKLVFDKLGIEARKPKPVPEPKVQAEKEDTKEE